jgi:hypothetical protein
MHMQWAYGRDEWLCLVCDICRRLRYPVQCLAKSCIPSASLSVRLYTWHKLWPKSQVFWDVTPYRVVRHFVTSKKTWINSNTAVISLSREIRRPAVQFSTKFDIGKIFGILEFWLKSHPLFQFSSLTIVPPLVHNFAPFIHPRLYITLATDSIVKQHNSPLIHCRRKVRGGMW